ncbi:MAG: D-2-hydroxyacid dehydrogenase [Candidatus Hydrogenedentota bacterium]
MFFRGGYIMRVLVSDKFPSEPVEKMKKAGLDVTVKTGMTPQELESAIGQFDVIIIRSATKVTKNIIDAAKNLKLIVRAGVGLDNVDVEYAKSKKIQVRNTPTATSISVAELTLGLMLACVRFIPRADASMKKGEWEKKAFEGTELYGKTLGIIGIGRIGQEVSKRARAFGMNVIAYDPYLPQGSDVKLVSFDELLSKSDFISLHVPLTDETKNMINDETLSKMKKGVIIINCSRGGVVSESALLKALNEDKVAKAGVDVYEKEPPLNYELAKHPNVIATPHLGASAEEGQLRAGNEATDIVIEFAKK